MKILFLITKSDVGGAQKYVADLAAALPRPEFQPTILTGGKNGIRFLSNAFRPYFLFLNDLAAIIEIAWKLHKLKPDILHLNSSKAGVVGAIAAKLHNVWGSVFEVRRQKIKVVFAAHGWVFNPQNALSPLKRKFYIATHKFAALFQDAIINVSEYDRQLALKEQIAPESKLFTIRNGIDYKHIKFLDKNSARDILIKNLKLKTNNLQLKTWIGANGRLVVEKNFETFIDAAALIKNEHTAFFIISDGYERQKLEAKIAALNLQNKFFLLGAIPDAAQYLKAFDVFVMSSIKEGLPYALLEAMAAGVPAIATRVGGMPEILEPNAGIIVPPRDPQALAGAIENLLANHEQANQITLVAAQRIYEELNLQTMTAKTMAVYHKLR